MSASGLLGAFLSLRPALARFLTLRGATADEAEDVLQEVYIKLWADKIGPVEEPRAYLYRMANNHFLLHRRSATRRGRREEEWVDLHSGDEREVDQQPTPEARLIAHEQLAILQRVLDELPERTRFIFHRFRIEGETQRQIAAQIGISVSAVEKHLVRAYQVIAQARLRFNDGVDHGS